MKKEYFSPEIEVVYMNMNQTLLAGSQVGKSDQTVSDFDELE